MHFEDLLQEVGEFGLFQKVFCFIFIPLSTGIVALTYYFQLFILTEPPHTCRQEGVDERLHELLNATPYNSELRHPYTCHQFPPNFTLPVNASSLASFSAPDLPCTDGWEYDFNSFFSSYAAERDWVCDEAWKNYMVVTVFWIGNTIGSWLWGLLSDMRGRRVAIMGSMLVYGVAGVASVFVKDFYVFSTLRFFVGSSHHAISHLPFVLVVEYCGLKARVIPLFTIMVTYTIGSILSAVIAWLVWDWTAITLIAAVPPLVIFLVTLKWVPESASWLITRGRGDEARKLLSKVAKVNGRELPEERLTTLLTGDEGVQGKKEGGTSNILQAARYPRLRCNILLVMLVWMLACLCYYGHCQNTANLGNSILMSYLLGALVEIPTWCVPLLINRLGRRLPLVCAFIISALAGFTYGLVPADIEWLVLVLALVGRTTICGAYYITLQYGPEVFPTEVRGQGVALSETLGGVAIFLSPSIVFLGEFQRTAPLLVFAGLSMLGGLATVFLPETNGVVLPQTLVQAEQFARSTPLCSCRSGSNGKEMQDNRVEE